MFLRLKQGNEWTIFFWREDAEKINWNFRSLGSSVTGAERMLKTPGMTQGCVSFSTSTAQEEARLHIWYPQADTCPKASDPAQFKGGLTLKIERGFQEICLQLTANSGEGVCEKVSWGMCLQTHCSIHYIVTKIFQVGHPTWVHLYLNTLLPISRNDLIRWPHLLFG